MLSLKISSGFVIEYVPMLSFNQSSLEAQFSLLRQHRLDTAAGYGSFINKSFESVMNGNELANNKCYDQLHIDDANRSRQNCNGKVVHHPLNCIFPDSQESNKISEETIHSLLNVIQNQDQLSTYTKYFGMKDDFDINSDNEEFILVIIWFCFI